MIKNSNGRVCGWRQGKSGFIQVKCLSWICPMSTIPIQVKTAMDYVWLSSTFYIHLPYVRKSSNFNVMKVFDGLFEFSSELFEGAMYKSVHTTHSIYVISCKCSSSISLFSSLQEKDKKCQHPEWMLIVCATEWIRTYKVDTII